MCQAGTGYAHDWGTTHDSAMYPPGAIVKYICYMFRKLTDKTVCMYSLVHIYLYEYVYKVPTITEPISKVVDSRLFIIYSIKDLIWG